MLPTAVDQKKRNKRDRLLRSALELFLEKGPASTSIDDIVQRAGVAKGTFYLYFKDRNDILEDLVVREGSRLVAESFLHARSRHPATPDEEILMAVREVLKKLKAAPELLILIHRNLSWSLISRRLSASEAGGEDCCRLARGRSPEEFRNLSFMILELVFSVAYSSIILGEPTGIDEMEPCLLDAVARLLR
jgi:AcrR family transcriptional regulator